MAIVTIPFDYDQLPDPLRIVPICIEDTDRDGCAINPGWFEAVVPVADPLRNLSRRLLNDVWRVSELAETSVHALWRKHRHNLGRNTSARIFTHAKWTAADLRVGGRNLRRGVEVELLDGVRSRLYTLPNATNIVLANEVKEMLHGYFGDHDAEHIELALDMWSAGFAWKEIAAVLVSCPRST